MSINWRERFLQTKTAYSNVRPEIQELYQQARDYRIAQEQERENNVGANGAETKFCRINASRDQNYPASAKWNFAIIDSEGRKRYLTPLECSDFGFDFCNGTSQDVPFLKNLADCFYLAHLRADEKFKKELNETMGQWFQQVDDIQKQHRDKPWRWPLYQEYLRSEEWKQKRSEVLYRDGNCCQLCGDEDNLRVHHLTYNRVGDEALFDLVTLCSHCHANEHSKEE
jgi:hypothetical protein